MNPDLLLKAHFGVVIFKIDKYAVTSRVRENIGVRMLPVTSAV